MKKTVFALLAVITLSGCTPVLKLIYGVKQPDFMSHEDIMKFQESIGLGSSDYYGLTSQSYLERKEFSFPEVFVFDSQGRFINYKDSLKPNCNGPAEQFLAELDSGRVYFYSDKYSLKEFTSSLEGSQCKPSELILQNDVNFYVFMNYVTFIGKKIHRQKTVLWLKALRENLNIKYQLIYINEDMKKCWSEEERKKFEEVELKAKG